MSYHMPLEPLAFDIHNIPQLQSSFSLTNLTYIHITLIVTVANLNYIFPHISRVAFVKIFYHYTTVDCHLVELQSSPNTNHLYLYTLYTLCTDCIQFRSEELSVESTLYLCEYQKLINNQIYHWQVIFIYFVS